VQDRERAAQNWPRVIWRAWRNEDDEEIAVQLYGLVSGQPAGATAVMVLALLGVFYGTAVGLFVKAMFWGWIIEQGQIIGRVLTFSMLAPFLLVGGLLGGTLSLLLHIVRKPWLTWRRLLARFSPMIAPELSPLPLEDTMAFVAGIIGGIVLAGPLGGAILGVLTRIGRTSNHSWERSASVGMMGGLLGGLIFLAILALAEPVAILAILGLLIVTLGQVVGLFLGLDLGLVGGWLWGLLAGSLGGVIVSYVFHPTAGLLVGTTIILINGVASLLRDSPHSWRWRMLWFWWSGRPTAAELELALRQAMQDPSRSSPWRSVLDRLNGRSPTISVADLASELGHRRWDNRFVARQRLAPLGGKAVQTLRELANDPSSESCRTARWLLQSIAAETAKRLADLANDLLCPRCLVRCGRLKISVPGPDLHYYGCRSCGQSREFQEWKGEIVAVLDNNLQQERAEAVGTMRVSWRHRKGLFDFDRVEILRAGEEDVERFALQVANDTDTFRRRRYREMVCTVGPEVTLSENTRRILGRLFGQVE